MRALFALCPRIYPSWRGLPSTLVLHFFELHVCFPLISGTFVWVVVHVIAKGDLVLVIVNYQALNEQTDGDIMTHHWASLCWRGRTTSNIERVSPSPCFCQSVGLFIAWYARMNCKIGELAIFLPIKPILHPHNDEGLVTHTFLLCPNDDVINIWLHTSHTSTRTPWITQGCFLGLASYTEDTRLQLNRLHNVRPHEDCHVNVQFFSYFRDMFITGDNLLPHSPQHSPKAPTDTLICVVLMPRCLFTRSPIALWRVLGLEPITDQYCPSHSKDALSLELRPRYM